MRHVFNDLSTIAHMWANQTQDNARNSGNFFYEGDTIYSYGRHFPIARHAVNAEGTKVVLFTTRGYSNTTSKHIAIVRQACNHLTIVYCHTPSQHSHTANFNDWIRRTEDAASSLPKAKKPEKYLSLIDDVRTEAGTYCAFFGIDMPAELAAALTISTKEQYAAYNGVKEELVRIAKEKEQADLLKRHKKELAEWLKGKHHRLYVRNGYDYLRIKDGRIETTQAVRLPIQLGQKIYNKLITNTLTPGDKILDYTIDSIGNELKVGCHTFKVSYLKQWGQKNFKTA